MVYYTKNSAVRLIVCIIVIVSSIVAQDYSNDYQQEEEEFPSYQDYADSASFGQPDNLYADYERHHEQKVAAVGGGRRIFALGSSILSYWIGSKIHSNRATKKIKKQFQKEKKELYSQYMNAIHQYDDEVKKLNVKLTQCEQNLKDTEDKAELDALQRDYDEFKQPDTDNDDRISKTEFDYYVENYLLNYPGLEEKDIPKFEDFDHDSDGYVSFQEYEQQMALQIQKAELEKKKKEEAAKLQS